MAYRKPPRFCIICGADAREGARISYRGKCASCGEKRAIEAVESMVSGEGPIAERYRAAWIEGTLRYVQSVIDGAE